jgi:hypothetical protein
MAGGNVNYKAVLVDLEARKAQIESAIAAVRSILTSGVGDVGGGDVTDVSSAEDIPRGTFLRLSIADATKKFLDMVKTKQSVPQITQALERGGLPPAKNNTVYAVLRRREAVNGDIIRIGDEWALAEWYPNNPNLRKRTPEKTKTKKAKKKAGGKKKAAPGQLALQAAPAEVVEAANATRKMSKGDALEEILKAAGGQAIHAKELAEILNRDYGKNDTNRTVAATMIQDPQKRFVNLGGNIWLLAKK